MFFLFWARRGAIGTPLTGLSSFRATGRLEVIERGLPGVAHADAFGFIWFSRNRIISRRAVSGGAIERWTELPFVPARDLLGRGRLLERAMRTDQCLVQPVSADMAMAIRGGTVFRARAEENVAIGTIQGDCPLRSSAATTSAIEANRSSGRLAIIC